MMALSGDELSCKNLSEYFAEEDGIENIDFLSEETRNKCKRFLRESAKLEEITPVLDEKEEDMEGLEKMTKANIDLSKDTLTLWKSLLRDALKRLDDSFHTKGGRIEEDITGVNELASYLNKFRNFETLLYGSGEWYRDHTWHLLWFFFVGEYMFRKHKLLDYIDREWYSKDKEAQFCIVALCHDLGYPIERIKNINKSLEEMLEEYKGIRFQPFQVDFPIAYKHAFDYLLHRLSLSVKPKREPVSNEFVIKQINDREYVRTEDRICPRPNVMAYFSTLLSKLDHGVISCLLLVSKLRRFSRDDCIEYKISERDGGDFWVDRDFMVSQYILKPIAYHSGKEVVIRKGERGLIYLWVMLCDDLTEWHRPTRSGGAQMISRQCRVYIESLAEDNISIRYLFNISSQRREPRYFFADKVLRYFGLLDDHLTLKIVVEDNGHTRERYEYLYYKEGDSKTRSVKMTCERHEEDLLNKKNRDLEEYMWRFDEDRFHQAMIDLRCPKCNKAERLSD